MGVYDWFDCAVVIALFLLTIGLLYFWYKSEKIFKLYTDDQEEYKRLVHEYNDFELEHNEFMSQYIKLHKDYTALQNRLKEIKITESGIFYNSKENKNVERKTN